jgi:hypothetical protein
MKELENLIDEGWQIYFRTDTKRVGSLNNRHWEDKITWAAQKGNISLKCAWDGFTKASDAIVDLIEKVNKI